MPRLSSPVVGHKEKYMKEVRLSIPVVGGITVVYTAAEIEVTKQALKKHINASIAYTSRLVCKALRINKIPVKTEVKVKAEYTVCPACGAGRPEGVCSVHGKR
jgi:hypothetical protein